MTAVQPGILRDELGVLPPGDVRQCLVALSHSSGMLRELFNFRYANGGLSGHNFGNIFLSTLEKITGNFNDAVREAGKILRIRGRVIPVTLENTKLVATLNSGMKIVGQNNIDQVDLSNLKKLELRPRAHINPEARAAIRQADKIIINPGNFFTTIIPCLLVEGMPEAIIKARAKKIFICNLMTKAGHTNGFTVIKFLEELEKYFGKGVIKYVVYNTEKFNEGLIKKYLKNKENFVPCGIIEDRRNIEFIGKRLLSHKIYRPTKSDRMHHIQRALVRHDSDKIANLIFEL